MKRTLLPTILLALFVSVFGNQVSLASGAYGVSAIRSDPAARTIYGFSSTYLDYAAGIYYDPEVVGMLYRSDDPETVLDSGADIGYASLVPARVYMITDDFRIGSVYCTFSQHFVRTVFAGPLPADGRDPFGLGYAEESAGGVFTGGDFDPDRLTPRRTYLGWTQICIQAGYPAPSPSPTPVPCNEGGEGACRKTRIAMAVEPSAIRPSGVRGGANRAGVGVCAYDAYTGADVPGVTIELDLARLPEIRNTGGHIDAMHVGARPLGRLAATRATTGKDGCVSLQYRPSHISGMVAVRAAGAGQTVTKYLAVMVPGLAPLQDGLHYGRIGSRPTHPDNHWGTPGTVLGLKLIADDYSFRYYGPDPIPETRKLRYNDLSLIWGGKFDLAGNWSTRGGHVEHREGINADVRCCVEPGFVPHERRAALRDIFNRRGSTRTLDETGSANPHWHLRFENYRRTLTGEEDVPVTIHDLVENAFWSVFDREAGQDEWAGRHARLQTAEKKGSEALRTEVGAMMRELFSDSVYVARGRGDEEFVGDVFSAYLLREPTAAETALWTDFLAGLPPSLPPNRRRARLLAEFEEDREFADLISGVVREETAPVPVPTPPGPGS